MVNAEVAAIDSLRIEPLSYALAFKVAGEAVHEESGNQQMDLKNVEKAIEHPELVESANLEVTPEDISLIFFYFAFFILWRRQCVFGCTLFGHQFVFPNFSPSSKLRSDQALTIHKLPEIDALERDGGC